MKIGIIGSGAVGQVLAAGFLKHGHEATIGTREPAKLAAWAKANPKARVASFPEALSMAGAGALAGKVVVDATNPIGGAPQDGVLPFFTGPNESLMELLQKRFPDARLVKAFNSVGSARMVNPDFGGVRPTMFICGNDAAAKATVTNVLDQFGWDTEDMGGAGAARAIEPLCMLWCIPGFTRGQWTHAFKLLK